MNTKIRLLSQSIINTFNQSDVPIEAKRLVAVEILQQLKQESDRIIKLEIDEQKRQEEQKKQEQLQEQAADDVDEAL